MIGNGRTAALVGLDGSIDWLCWPRLYSAAVFAALLGAPENGRWLLAPRSPTVRVRRRYRADTPAQDGIPDGVRLRRRCGLHAVDRPARLARAHRRRSSRARRFSNGFRRSIQLWRERSVGYANRRRHDRRNRRLRATGAANARRLARRRSPHRGRVHRRGRRAHPVRPVLRRFVRRVAERARPLRSFGRDRDVLAPLGGPLPVCWPMDAGRQTVADHAEGFDVLADRRNRRRGNDVTPRAAGRREELGLSLLLVARRDGHSSGLHEPGVLRGGAGVARLAHARGSRQSASNSDDVRRRRRADAARVERPLGRPATKDHCRCESETMLRSSCRSTCLGRSPMRCSRRLEPGTPRRSVRTRYAERFSNTSQPPGAGPMKASGKCAVDLGISFIPR